MSRWRAVVGLALFGVGLCLALDVVYARSSTPPLAGRGAVTPLADLVESGPFLVLGLAAAVFRSSRTAIAAATLALSALTWVAYDGAWTGTTVASSRTLLVPWLVGVPVVFLIALLDGALRRADRADPAARPGDVHVDYEFERQWSWPFR
jgi:hypothetical protein